MFFTPIQSRLHNTTPSPHTNAVSYINRTNHANYATNILIMFKQKPWHLPTHHHHHHPSIKHLPRAISWPWVKPPIHNAVTYYNRRLQQTPFPNRARTCKSPSLHRKKMRDLRMRAISCSKSNIQAYTTKATPTIIMIAQIFFASCTCSRCAAPRRELHTLTQTFSESTPLHCMRGKEAVAS